MAIGSVTQLIDYERRTIEIAKRYGGGGGEPYVLPTASASQLGGVKVGSGLAINESGCDLSNAKFICECFKELKNE